MTKINWIAKLPAYELEISSFKFVYAILSWWIIITSGLVSRYLFIGVVRRVRL